MKRAAMILAALAAIHAATAAPVRTATESFVTNKIAEAVATIPAPDFSTGNTQLVATIEATAPAPGNYAAISNAAMSAVQPAALVAAAQSATNYTASAANTLSLAINSKMDKDFASGYFSVGSEGLRIVYNDPNNPPEKQWSFFWYDNVNQVIRQCDLDSATNGLLRAETDPTVPAWAKAARKPTYTASEVGATTPADVTAAIREQSLGGIWDEALQVWWTPRMRNGSLTYEATTNVNLNAEN